MKIKKIPFPKVTKKQTVEFGLVAILVTSVFAFWLNDKNLVLAIIILSLVTIITPVLLYPFAALWFGISKVLSYISSTIILGFSFFKMYELDYLPHTNDSGLLIPTGYFF